MQSTGTDDDDGFFFVGGYQCTQCHPVPSVFGQPCASAAVNTKTKHVGQSKREEWKKCKKKITSVSIVGIRNA